MEWDCIVIGAGQSGLSAGYYLKQTGLKFTLLDRHTQAGGSWQDYFKSLTLFSPARYSSLSGMDFPGNPNHYPSRNEVITYLRRYAHQFNLPVIPSTMVQRIEHNIEGFRLHTNNNIYATKTVIVGTGPFNTPYYPSIPDSDKFRGRILHAYHYEDTTPYANQRIIVVGARESAIQIAVELAQVADVTLATRRPLQFIPQRILGLDIHFFLHGTGYDTIPLGLWKKLKGSKRIVEAGTYRQALKTGNPRQMTLFKSFTEDGVIWANGEREAVDTVIFATGYRVGLDYLSGLSDALDKQGYPIHRGGISTTVQGLYYVGLFGQRSHASATLRGVSHDAHYIVSKLTRFIAQQ